jgi:outer membrane DcaP-like protein
LIKTTRLRAALLGSGAAFALMAGPALAGESDDLKAQIEQLQSRLDQLEKQQGATDAKVDAKQAAAPADAVVGGDFPGSFKLPGSDTSMAIHGYTKLDVLIDINQQAGDSFDVTALAPNGSPAERRGGPQFRLHARQSRLTFETRTPTNYGQLQTFIQGDFFGAGGNQFFSNSSSFRLRHAYGVLGPVLAGQTNSNFYNVDDNPETLDFQGPAGQIFARQPQVRYTQTLGKFRLSGSIENPEGDLTASTGATSNGAIPQSPNDAVHNINRAPDLTVKGVYTDAWGHISVSGIGRRFETDNGGGDATGLTNQESDAWGGGGDISGTISIGKFIPFAPIASDQIGFNGFYGSGIGRYAHEGGGVNGAVIKNFPGTAAVKVRLETQPTWGGFVWYLHNWTDTLRSNVVFGIQGTHWSDAIPNPGNSLLTDRIDTAHVNLIWSPIKSVNLGVEYMWGERDFHTSPFAKSGTAGTQKAGNDNRMQFSAQYLF